MLVLCSIKPRPAEFAATGTMQMFNYDTEDSVETARATKLIYDALERGCTVQTRKIRERLAVHPTAMQLAMPKEQLALALHDVTTRHVDRMQAGLDKEHAR